MGWHTAMSVLAVLNKPRGITNILSHLSSQSHGKSLYASANTQHRYLPVIGKSGDKQFRYVALTIDGMQFRRRFLATKQGVIVASATEHKRVDAVESVDNNISIVNRRYDYGHTSRCHYHLVVAFRQHTLSFVIIGGNTNHRFALSLRKPSVNLIQPTLPIQKHFNTQLQILN